jgi:vanillate O-demethylase monooxygenase subunit
MADRIVDHPTITFIRNTWYPALWAGELTPGKLFPRTLLNEPVLFFRREDGTVAAIADTCSHRFAPLSMGQLLPGDRVQCPYHGLEFTGDGRCVLNPHGTGAIPAAAHLRSYPLVERHTVIWIWMGDKPAEPDKIPDFSCMDEADPLNVTEPGHVLMKANYELIVDNLLDNSHTPFVHPGILGNKDLMASEVTVTTRGDIVTLSRIVKNAESPGLLKLMGAVEHGDQWNITDWFAPSCLLLIVGASPAGQPQSAASGFYAIHLLAPETERTTHYNFSAVRFNTPPESEETKQRIRADTARLRGFAFGEQDGPIIAAQQLRMDQSVIPLQPALLSIDAGPVQYHRVLARLLREEHAAT